MIDPKDFFVYNERKNDRGYIFIKTWQNTLILADTWQKLIPTNRTNEALNCFILILFFDEKVKSKDLHLEITPVTFSFGAPSYLPNWIYFHLILSYRFPTRNTYWWNLSIIVSLSQAMQNNPFLSFIVLAPINVLFSNNCIFPSLQKVLKRRTKYLEDMSLNLLTQHFFRFAFFFDFLLTNASGNLLAKNQSEIYENTVEVFLRVRLNCFLLERKT